MFKAYILPILIVVTLLIAFFINKEKFDPGYISEKEVYIKTDQFKTNVISTGDVQKYKTDDGYIYLLKINLPETQSPFQTQDLTLPFNTLTPYIPYEVYADGVKIGELKRSGDGWFRMELKTKENYTEFKVYLGVVLVGNAEIF